jgi:hypothetical protein
MPEHLRKQPSSEAAALGMQMTYAPSRARRRLILRIVAVSALLVIVGVWTNHAMKEYLQETLEDTLQRLLDGNIATLEMWFDLEKTEIQYWSRTPDFLEHVLPLAEAATGSTDPGRDLPNSPHDLALRRLLSFSQGEKSDRGFIVVSRTARIIASSHTPLVGSRITEVGMGMLGPAFDRQVRITMPFHLRDVLTVHEGLPTTPMIMATAPVLDDQNDVAAVLAFVIDPNVSMAQRLSEAQMGKRGDTYTFNQSGLMLSRSIRDVQLKAIGLLPDEPDATSALTVQIRNPGGDMTKGHQPATAAAAWPLTRMAASATAGQSGVDVKGYRDYRGVMVVGAWRWLPDYNLGAAIEVPKTTAFGVLRPLHLAFYSLFGLLVLAALLMVVQALREQGLRRRIAEVRKLGQYTLEQKIGEGGMGEVYRARHAMLRRPTALKLLRSEAAGTESIARFEREVQLTSALTHPNTVEIYDFGRTPEGIFYYVMEYLPGVTLARLIELDGAVPPNRVIYILRQVCASLEEAHREGIIHRDIKPLNIMLCRRGGQADFVKVLDFGLVKDTVSQPAMELTLPQVVTGTPLYIAPERLRDPLHADPRTDIYSIGAVGFNLLTGQDVFGGASAMEQCHHVMQTPPQRPSERLQTPIPEALDTLIVECLAKDPRQRPPDVAAMMETLETIDDVEPWTQADARRWWNEHESRFASDDGSSS